MCLFQMDSSQGNEDEMLVEYASCKTIIKNCDKTRQAQANQALMDIIGQSLNAITMDEESREIAK